MPESLSGTSITERIASSRELIAGDQERRAFLQGLTKFYIDPESAPAKLRKNIRILGVVLMSEGRRLGGLVTSEKRRNERRR